MARYLAKGKDIVPGISVQLVAAATAVDIIVAASSVNSVIPAGAAQVIGILGSSDLLTRV